MNNLELAHSIKTLEVIHSSIEYWQSPDDIKDLIEIHIIELRKSLRSNCKDGQDVGYVVDRPQG